MTLDKLNLIKSKYGGVASWAIWAASGSGDTSDVSIFDLRSDNVALRKLHTKYVLVALNISGQIKIPFGNFHGGPRDFMLRDALNGTPLEGAYLTDLLKNYEDKSSAAVVRHFKKNTDEFNLQIADFLEELIDVGANQRTTLIALGEGVYQLLQMASVNYKVEKLRHYSFPAHSKKSYRQEVRQLLTRLGVAEYS